MGGEVREMWGDYGTAFFAAGLLAVLAGLLALRIQRQQPLPASAAA